VLYRRILYFLAVIATIALLAMPWWVDGTPFPNSAEGRYFMERLTSWSVNTAPDTIMPWVEAFRLNPVVFLLLLVAAIGLRQANQAMRTTAWTRSRRLWDERLSGMKPYSLPGPSWVTRLWSGKRYQRVLQVVKWRLLPAFAALVLFVALLVGLLAFLTQAIWSVVEPMHCEEADKARGNASGPVVFRADAVCNATGITVRRGLRYEISFRIPAGEEWNDDGFASWNTTRRTGERLDIARGIGQPFKRLVNADYMAPIMQVYPEDPEAPGARIRTRELNPIHD
jgi:hypothetical protein